MKSSHLSQPQEFASQPGYDEKLARNKAIAVLFKLYNLEYPSHEPQGRPIQRALGVLAVKTAINLRRDFGLLFNQIEREETPDPELTVRERLIDFCADAVVGLEEVMRKRSGSDDVITPEDVLPPEAVVNAMYANYARGLDQTPRELVRFVKTLPGVGVV